MLLIHTALPCPADCASLYAPPNVAATKDDDYSVAGEEDPGAALDTPRSELPLPLSAASALA